MSSCEEVIAARLYDTTDITDVVEDRIWPAEKAAQDPDYPFIVYTRLDASPISPALRTGVSADRLYDIVVDCYAVHDDDARDLSQLVVDALDGYRIGVDSLQGCFYQTSSTPLEIDECYHVVATFQVAFTEG